MNIHQVSVLHVPTQDRLLLRISTGEGLEIRLWLTRRMVLALLPALQSRANEQLVQAVAVATPAAMQNVNSSPAASAAESGAASPGTALDTQRQHLLESFQREALAYAGDYDTPYQPPAGGTGGEAPLLVTDVTLSLPTSGNLLVNFAQKLEGTSRDVEITMSPQLTQGLLHLVNQGIKQSGWLEVPAAATAATLPDPMRMPAAEKSGYLN